MSAEDLSIEALVERYNALTQDVVEALNAEFQRHGCPKVTAKFDPSKRWVRIHHQSDPPQAPGTTATLIMPLETLENLTKEPALSAELSEDDRLFWLTQRTKFLF